MAVSVNPETRVATSVDSEPTRLMTDGKLEVRRRAWQAIAAEELTQLLMDRAVKAFIDHEDEKANTIRSDSEFAAGWAKNERECQKRLEKIHGRYDR